MTVSLLTRGLELTSLGHHISIIRDHAFPYRERDVDPYFFSRLTPRAYGSAGTVEHSAYTTAYIGTVSP